MTTTIVNPCDHHAGFLNRLQSSVTALDDECRATVGAGLKADEGLLRELLRTVVLSVRGAREMLTDLGASLGSPGSDRAEAVREAMALALGVEEAAQAEVRECLQGRWIPISASAFGKFCVGLLPLMPPHLPAETSEEGRAELAFFRSRERSGSTATAIRLYPAGGSGEFATPGTPRASAEPVFADQEPLVLYDNLVILGSSEHQLTPDQAEILAALQGTNPEEPIRSSRELAERWGKETPKQATSHYSRLANQLEAKLGASCLLRGCRGKYALVRPLIIKPIRRRRAVSRS